MGLSDAIQESVQMRMKCRQRRSSSCVIFLSAFPELGITPLFQESNGLLDAAVMHQWTKAASFFIPVEFKDVVFHKINPQTLMQLPGF